MLFLFLPLMMVDGGSQPRPTRCCPQCQSRVSEAARFCTSCGRPLPPPPTVCPQCGTTCAPGARFCKECGHALAVEMVTAPARPPAPPPIPPPPPPAAVRLGSPAAAGSSVQTGSPPRRGRLAILLIGCGGLVLLCATVAGGYLAYRFWPSKPAVEQAASGVGVQEVDADWATVKEDQPNLVTAEREIAPHVDRLLQTLKAGNLNQALSMTLPDLRSELRSAFEGRPERMERFARLLETRRLVVAHGDLAEFEVTEDGKTFHVILQRIGDRWMLHSF